MKSFYFSKGVMKCVLSYLLVLFAVFIAVGCERRVEDPDPDNSVEIKAPIRNVEEIVKQDVPVEEIPDHDEEPNSFAAATAPKFSPEVEAKIDKLIDGRTDFEKLLEDEELIELIQKIEKPWDPEITKRIDRATAVILRARYPDADPSQLDEKNFDIMPTDVSFFRTMLGHALNDNAEGLQKSMAEWAEGVAAQAMIDPRSADGASVKPKFDSR